ncbi:hypothetical protein QBC47DRAFT_296234 [Echria macrotheca]|uniref:HMG box domain-containing protein n=1 Tax=Echria macrotheca TaxID=438768 RepID=A0AAJ0FDG2_9PEZI|nr:hypothetical protein QBC47DRAFT_296234 [Echria macrotheca]
MDRNTPPSPAPSKSEMIPSGFHELMHHNATTSYPHEAYGMESGQLHSQPGSRHGTPVHALHAGYDHYLHQRGGGDHLVGRYHQQMYSQQNSPYGPIPEISQPYSTPATSPPTPSRASDVITTRSGTMIQRGAASKALGPKAARVEKSVAKKKKDRAKPVKNMPNLDKPMSELTQASQIPVADIESYVSRSVETRRREVETGKNPGRVKRPMNAFMLYRKAYQQRAKEWASQHNHQIVSRVCGLSWPLEPEAIRQQFKDWADIERDNHQKAHPDYKFTPSKPQKQKFREGKFIDSDGSDLDEFDFSRNRTMTNTPSHDADDDYVPPRSIHGVTMFPYQGMYGMAAMNPNRSAFEYSNPGKPMPAPYDHRDLAGQYYETHVRSQQRPIHQGTIEDVVMRKTPSPNFTYRSMHSHYDPGHYASHSPYQSQSPVMEPQPPPPPPMAQPQRLEHRIDPSLMPQEGSIYDPGNLNLFLDSATQQSWAPSHFTSGGEPEGQFNDALLGLEDTMSAEQHVQYLRGADDWQVESIADAGQFDTSWMDQASHKTD